MDDGGVAMRRLLDFSRSAVTTLGGKWTAKTEDVFEASLNAPGPVGLTSSRDRALREDGLALLGLEQPFIRGLFERMQSMPAADRGLIAVARGVIHKGMLTFWSVTVRGKNGQVRRAVIRLGLTIDGQRAAAPESLAFDQFTPPISTPLTLSSAAVEETLTRHVQQLLHREVEHCGCLAEGAWYSSRLLGLVLAV